MASKITIHDTLDSNIMSILHDGPKATITVGTGSHSLSFILPKALLCYHSTTLNSAFNGHFKEASTLQYSFPETTIVAFQKFVNWIDSGTISIVDNSIDKTFLCPEEGAMEPHIAIDFFALADEMDLLGAENYTPRILQEIRPLLSKITDKDPYLNGTHILSAFTRVPSKHAFRTLIMQACVKPYLLATQTKPRREYDPFPFMKEIEEVEQFGEEFLEVVEEARDAVGKGVALDPFGEREFLVNAWLQ